jgi:8-amino-7-oxononanoate synthase
MALHFDFESHLESLRSKNRHRDLVRSTLPSFVHNDYLGVSGHPLIREAGQRALEKYAAGSRGSRLLGGNHPCFERLEYEIAEFFGAPAALFFSTGYLANLAVVRAVANFCDVVVSDEKNHASLIDAIALTKLPKILVNHGDWPRAIDLSEYRRPLFVAETLFSMDGDFADLGAIKKQLDARDGFLILDEAHAAGVFGEGGGGRHPELNFNWEKLAVSVTFGKAFGVSGAAVLGSKTLVELLVNTARSFIYTTAPSPVIAEMVRASLGVVKSAANLRTELWSRARRVRETFKAMGEGSATGADLRSPIIPFHIPGELRALRFCENMRESGIELRAIRYPTVARGSERIRISLNLGESRPTTEKMASEVVRLWMESL